MALSRIIVAGNLGRDPEVREVGDTSVCRFSVPLTTRRRGEEATHWFNVDAWGRLGEVCAEHLNKGSGVVVDGELQVREYQKDGETKQVLDIRASQVHFVSKGNSGGSASAEGGSGDDEDSLPF